MESVQRIMVRAEVFRQGRRTDCSLEHSAQRCAVDDAGVQAKPDDASGKLVHHHQYPMSSQRSGLTSEQVAAPQAVLRVAKKGEPGGTTPVRFRPVVNAQNTANRVLVNFNPESQSDLLSDARTAPTRIPAFHLHHGIDEFFGRALGAGTTSARRRKQQPILSLDQHAVEMQ
jgi:hypothetical protein